MLAANNYSQDYIDTCRAGVGRQVSAYEALPPGPALQAFEPLFFNNMVLVLDAFFVHRLRGMEGKDGNPLNEVRVLCSSLMQNDAVLTVEKAIKLKPAESVLGLEPGDRIALSRDDFARLAEAFFAEIERRYRE